MCTLCRGISFDKLGQFDQVSFDVLQLLAMKGVLLAMSQVIELLS